MADFTVPCSSVSVVPVPGRGTLKVSLEDVELDELIEAIDEATLLDAIGKDACKQHFDLIEEE